MKQKLSNFLVNEGYFYVETSLPEFFVFFTPMNSSVELVTVIDYQKEIYLTEEIYKGICENLKKSFYEKGFKNVHMITIVLYKEYSQIFHVFDRELFCWYIDTLNDELNIPVTHVENFYGLKEKLERFLLNSDSYIQIQEDVEQKYSKIKEKKKISQLPYMNIIIIVINVFVFILCAFGLDMLYNKGAFSIHPIMEGKEFYRTLTSVFLHADIQHLFNNMLILYFLGDLVEEKLGHVQYVLLYFISAIVGNVASAVYELCVGQYIFSIGASGAIFGVVGAVLTLVVCNGGKWRDISLPRILLMVIYALYSGFISENINNIAHIGGFVAGIFFVTIYHFTRKIKIKKEASYEN